MEDEQLLVIDTEKGLCVFAGCCHAGIINCLSFVQSSFPGRPIYSVLAGMHLGGVNEDRLEKTIEALDAMGISLLMPVHCTGIYAIGRMKERLRERCMILETGRVFSFESRRKGEERTAKRKRENRGAVFPLPFYFPSERNFLMSVLAPMITRVSGPWNT